MQEFRNESANTAYLQANGTGQFYHQPNSTIQYTEEVRDMLIKCEAWWLLSEILLANKFVKAVKDYPFQNWKLEQVKKGESTFILKCEDGNDNILWKKTIPFSDFPYKDVTIWLEGGNLFFPSQR